MLGRKLYEQLDGKEKEYTTWVDRAAIGKHVASAGGACTGWILCNQAAFALSFVR